MKLPAERDGWALHEQEQRELWLELTHDERLAWLEGMRRFAIKYLGAAQKKPQEATGPHCP